MSHVVISDDSDGDVQTLRKPRKEWTSLDVVSDIPTPRDFTAKHFRQHVQKWICKSSEPGSKTGGKPVGKLGTVWTASGLHRVNARCVDCQECHLGRGRFYRFESELHGEKWHLKVFVSREPCLCYGVGYLFTDNK